MSKLILNKEYLNQLCQLVQERIGVIIQDNQLNSLSDYISKKCIHYNYKSCQDYLDAIKKSSVRSTEFEDLISAITIGESYFFRHKEQIDFLQNHWLPKIVHQRRQENNKFLRIWSAGCASGQEIYSIAILLKEIISDIDDWNIHLLGTDINSQVLSKAINAHFSQWSFRSTTQNIIDHYFQPTGSECQLRPEIKNMVNFSYHNLILDEYPSILTQTNAIDLIFCCNVFIYFDSPTITRVLKRFEKCLIPDGLLLLGPSDFVPAINIHGLASRHKGNITYFVRETKSAKASIKKGLKFASRVKKVFLQHLEKKSVLIATNKAFQTVSDKKLNQLNQLLVQKDWQEALQGTEGYIEQYGENALLLQYKAKALANLGRRNEAVMFCEQSLELNQIDHHTYLLKALVLLDLNQIDEAEHALKQVIFLNPNFIEAQYQLGLLLLRKGENEKGLKKLYNILQKVKKLDSNYKMHHMPETIFGQFAEILKHEIRIYEMQK